MKRNVCRIAALAFTVLAGVWPLAGMAQDSVKIGLLSDFGGPNADIGGPGNRVAAEMAVKDFGATVLGKKIEILQSDHEGKPDVGTTIARRWFDQEGVSMITDIAGSPVALAVQALGKEKKKITIVTTASVDVLTNAQCSPYGIHWTYDSYSLGKIVAASFGTPGSTWFYLAVDNAGGTGLMNALTPQLEKVGAKVLGNIRHPLGSADMSSYLLQAQASGAQYVVVANSGSDADNAIKQANEFGLTKSGQTLVALAFFYSDIKALGLANANGIRFSSGFFPGANPEASAWAKRFYDIHHAMPTDVQAGTYSAVLHYLQAVKAAGTLDAEAVMAKMHEMPVNDMFAKGGYIRKDGRMVHDMYLVRAKLPSESTGPTDQVALVKVIKGEDAFRPLSESVCPLVK